MIQKARMNNLILTLLVFCSTKCSVSMYVEINEYAQRQLTSYELIEERRIIHKRSQMSNEPTVVKLSIFNKTIQLNLSPTQPQYISNSFSVVVRDAKSGSDSFVEPSFVLAELYSGYVVGDPTSKVSGYYANNLFIGTVHSKASVLTLESVAQLTGNVSDTRLLAYYDHHMKLNNSKESVPASCGYQNVHKSISNVTADHQELHNSSSSSRRRIRRSLNTEKVCTLLMVADYAYFSRIGLGQIATTVRSLIRVLHEVNQVYHATQFFDKRTKRPLPRFGFELSSVIVMNSPATDKEHFNYHSEDNPEESPSMVLETFGNYNENKIKFQEYCIAHLFTYKRMHQNILGLAYINGMCNKSVFRAKHGRKAATYQNTGFTTYQELNGSPVLTRRATLVTVHELGHNVGSKHDETPQVECTPSALDGGSYVMNPVAVLGTYKNNNKFSPCSIREMSVGILFFWGYCLSDPSQNFCGDHKVDEASGEACDAGIMGDQCCDKDCNLRERAECSDANSPCCLKCKRAPRNHICSMSSIMRPCTDHGRCDGFSLKCPPAPHRDDGIGCNLGVGKCLSGVCESLCHPNKPCSCPEAKDSCILCCSEAGSSSSCAPRLSADGRAVPLPLNYGCGEDGRCLGNGTCARMISLHTGGLTISLFSGKTNRSSFLSNNIVLITVVISLLVWVPACIVWIRQHLPPTVSPAYT